MPIQNYFNSKFNFRRKSRSVDGALWIRSHIANLTFSLLANLNEKSETPFFFLLKLISIHLAEIMLVFIEWMKENLMFKCN